MEKFKKVDYELKNIKGTILVSEDITEETIIKELCFKDYLEKLSKEIRIIKEEN